jgi:Fur family zinc uptake transcriptional regulator
MYACADHEICVGDALQKADMICQDKGLRFTELRRKVLAMIWAGHGSAKAYDILDKLNDEGTAAKPPTVYRVLDFLLENGLIHKLESLNSYVGCSHPLEHNECYFLICSKCGEIKECCDSTLAQAITRIASKNKFSPRHITLEIQGKCQECAKKT